MTTKLANSGLQQTPDSLRSAGAAETWYVSQANVSSDRFGVLMHGLRVRFHVPPGFFLEPAESQLELPGAPEPLTMRQLPPRPDALPSDVGVVTIDGNGFASASEATQFGRSLKGALAVCSARHRFGFDLGQDIATSSLGKIVRDQIREKGGVDVRPTIHGLDVFETTTPIQRFEAHARGSVSRPIRALPSELARELPCPPLSAKLALALELYNCCAYELDMEVRFLSLVTVLEAMADRKRRAQTVEEFVDSCLESLCEADSLGVSDVEMLRSGLGNLKVQSISQACMDLVNAAGADVQFFKQVYKARSELLHDGLSTTHPDLPRQPHRLDDLVQTVLLDQVSRASSSAG
jgi:hypothetical protein